MEHCQSSGAKKRKTLFSFLEKVGESTTSTHYEVVIVEVNTSAHHPPISSPQFDPNLSPQPSLQPSILIERDPEKRKHISEHPINLKDEIRWVYLRAGPYQPILLNYQNSALVTDGFNNWKRVNQGDECAFLTHISSTPSSFHNMFVRRAEDLMKPSGHIDKVMNAITREEVLKNRLRLKTTILSVKWLPLQGCAFKGHDESSSLLNRGNFIELMKAFAKMNIEIGEVVLDKAPQDATYTIPNVQKEILHIMANRVRQMIHEELGENCFCILVNEAQDESKREQMAIILRFVNNDGIRIECFFTIKSVKKIRGQGYDGASNMRGTRNRLRALFFKECPYAYYIQCFAHRLQLTLVPVAKYVICIWKFFSFLDNIVNIITSSPKLINALQTAQRR
ncbi:zinc finger MYM-type protein 1-like [Olea europaea var. sylvestris]|uniref:zinc finger MYM-type protein 1-like n=1 Tax=Olea europaea var. sylvestris TaxID=158386 RepID=UPI000C1D1803|nr:zinc finger MYM-type protein 1-like [Olea europaea var. sylvestris]